MFNNPGLASEGRKGFYSSAFYRQFCKGLLLDCIHNFLCCHLHLGSLPFAVGVLPLARNGDVLGQRGTKCGCKKKKCKKKSNNLARAAKKNYPSTDLFPKSPFPPNSSNKTKKKFHSSPSHCSSQSEIICTNIYKKHSVSVSCIVSEGDEGESCPRRVTVSLLQVLPRERCYWGQKCHARETAYSCYTQPSAGGDVEARIQNQS